MVNVMLAGGIAMPVALLGTPLFIRFLVRRGYGQPIHDDLVLHHVKRGKPTMGGAVIIGRRWSATSARTGCCVVGGRRRLAGVTRRPGVRSAPSWCCSSWSGSASSASSTTSPRSARSAASA